MAESLRDLEKCLEMTPSDTKIVEARDRLKLELEKLPLEQRVAAPEPEPEPAPAAGAAGAAPGSEAAMAKMAEEMKKDPAAMKAAQDVVAKNPEMMRKLQSMQMARGGAPPDAAAMRAMSEELQKDPEMMKGMQEVRCNSATAAGCGLAGHVLPDKDWRALVCGSRTGGDGGAVAARCAAAQHSLCPLRDRGRGGAAR